MRLPCPFTGMFAPDRSYYWRVRVQDRNGVWFAWSPVWEFTWQGPCIPIHLKSRQKEDEIILTWEPNPRGELPVRYKVYGSNIKGFSIHDTPHIVQTLGEIGPNLVGEFTDTNCVIVSPEPDKPDMNKTFYRVVTKDEHGTESGCSDYLELPHPLLVNTPSITTERGKPFRFKATSLFSMGDLQYRREEPNHGFWDKEELHFELLSGQEWLRIDRDEKTGENECSIEGMFSERGTFRFRLRVNDQKGNQDCKDFSVLVE